MELTLTILYNGVDSCIINYDVTSKYFPLAKDVKQGDPIYLFILAVEMLGK